MNIKTSVTAVLLVAAGAVSACSSSTDKSAAVPTSMAPTSTVSTASGTAATTSAPAATAPATTARATSAPARSSSTAPKGSAHGDIPDAALLATSDLAAAPSGKWSATPAEPTVPASNSVDPDNCDPILRPQAADSGYPRNPAWVNTRTATWTGSGQVSEVVVTYKSAADASADYAKHQGWVADCAAHFQWTDAPQKFAVSPVSLPGVSGAYAIHAGMYGENESASAAGSQGYDYMAVILRGNTLTVLNVSQTAIDGPKPSDPGPAGFQHDVQAAAAALAIVYES